MKRPSATVISGIMVTGIAAVLIVILIGSLIIHYAEGDDDENVGKFTIDEEANTFLMDGKPFHYISGSFHYFRAHPNAWQKRMRTMKSAGLNVIDTYVEWSLHNPRDGVYEWSGIADVEKYLELAQAEGFYVILRPGPYICAERDNGGIPYWLFTKYPDIRLRTSDEDYINEVGLWYSKLMPRMERFLYGNGGPIIMVQVENEYGAFYACDRIYLNWLRDETLKYVKENALLFTTDIPDAMGIGCGKIRGVFATIDFGIDRIDSIESAWETLRLVQPRGPLVNSEFYPGWLTHWQEPNQRRNPHMVAEALRTMLKYNASVNFYMFFGGTNFGFTAGANDFGESKYTPDITSYDYDAVMDEVGNITRKFKLVRDVIRQFKDVPEIHVEMEKTSAYGRVAMKPVLNMLSAEGRTILANGNASMSIQPKSFEELDQFSGLVLYETDISHINDNGNDNVTYALTVNDLRDRALVYIDMQLIGILSRQNEEFNLTIENFKGSKLQLLVENQGRINFNVANDRKGIFGSVTLKEEDADLPLLILENWSNTGFPLEEPHISKLFASIQNNTIMTELGSSTQNISIATNAEALNGPIIYYGEFSVFEVCHTYLNPMGWGKGVAFVNGFNLGRYWPVAGPQLTLYVPQEILHKGQNSMVLIEYEQDNRVSPDDKPFITLDGRPQLDMLL